MKQRLVGTVVIGSLAIIFIPILLDGEGVSAPELTTSIPAAPTMPEVPVVEPSRPETSSDNTSQEASETPLISTTEETATQETPPAPDTPRLNDQGVPETWSVRLGSFGELANAEALVSRLRENGYKGFSRRLDTSKGPLTGVYVGPVMTQSEAGKLQQELSDAFELEGVVVQFSIDELEEP